jgi:hypothetical protein
MSHSRLFEIPTGAWYSIPLYQEVASRWTGLNALYLFLFLLISWFPWVVKEQGDLNKFAEEWVEPLISEFPRFGISSGKLWVDGEPRRTISDPKTGRPLLLIDTTGQTLSLVGLSIPALVTADSFIMRNESGVEEKMSFSHLPNRAVTSQELKRFVADWIPSLLWYSYPFFLIGSFLFRIIQVFLLAGVGLIVCPLLETDLPLPALIRISVLAITPAMILRTLCNVLEITIPFCNLLLTLVTIGYLVFGISANRLVKGKGFRDSRSEW